MIIIIQNLRGIPISTPLLNSCHWIYKDEDHNAFVTKLMNLKSSKTLEHGLGAMYETKRVHIEKMIKKAHELIVLIRDFQFKSDTEYLLNDFISDILLSECNEAVEINNIIKTFELNESVEPCIKLEVALAGSSSLTLLSTAKMISRSKNLECISEKIRMNYI